MRYKLNFLMVTIRKQQYKSLIINTIIFNGHFGFNKIKRLSRFFYPVHLVNLINRGSDNFSGLLRSARNDGGAFSSHVSRHCEARSNPENHLIQKNHINHSSDKKRLLGNGQSFW